MVVHIPSKTMGNTGLKHGPLLKVQTSIYNSVDQKKQKGSYFDFVPHLQTTSF